MTVSTGHPRHDDRTVKLQFHLCWIQELPSETRAKSLEEKDMKGEKKIRRSKRRNERMKEKIIMQKCLYFQDRLENCLMSPFVSQSVDSRHLIN